MSAAAVGKPQRSGSHFALCTRALPPNARSNWSPLRLKHHELMHWVQPLPACRHRLAAAADVAQGLDEQQQQQHPCVIGIDLGTSFSAVAALKGGKPYVLEDPGSGQRTVPSVVTFTKEDCTAVGWEALGCDAGPADRIYSFKRLMGQRWVRIRWPGARVASCCRRPPAPRLHLSTALETHRMLSPFPQPRHRGRRCSAPAVHCGGG